MQNTNFSRFRTIDGSQNSLYGWGAAGTPLFRLFQPAYENGIDVPRGGAFNNSTLPNPRTVSNAIGSQTESIPIDASEWSSIWGQFLTHDIGLNKATEETPAAPGDSTPIAVPQNDPNDLFVQNGVTTIPFTRVPEFPDPGIDTPRQQSNQVTTFIDASAVYGSNQERADFLRSFNGGLLKTTVIGNGEILPPFNTAGLPNESLGPIENFYLTGDIRANSFTPLIAIHSLFIREHNRLAREIQGRLEGNEAQLVRLFESFQSDFSRKNPTATLAEIKDEFLYQAARQVVGAQMQVITYNEFLPLLVGDSLLNNYAGYDKYVNPSLSHAFTNAAFRATHSNVPDLVRRIDSRGITEISTLELASFNLQDLQTNGIDSLIQGSIFTQTEAIDTFQVDSLRNVPIPSARIGIDLFATDLARGRDVGLPGYVEVYNQLFPNKQIVDFADLPFAPNIVEVFKATYSDVSQIDLLAGGLAEIPDPNGGMLGPTFTFLIKEQFVRLRDGDRFFFLEQNQLNQLQILDPDILNTTFASIIRQNTENSFLVPDNVFQVPFDNEVIGDLNKNFLIGGKRKDLINGKEGNDTLLGGKGDDILLGGDNDDILLGGKGDDTLLGGNNDDILLGRKGNDLLKGDLGNDQYIGGKGADIFAIASGEGLDTIKDFNRRQGDKIALTGGLSFSDLTLSRLGRSSTLISFGTEDLAIVRGERFTAIDENSFTIL